MKLAFHPEAAREFEEAVRFYQQRGPHLARRFNSEVRIAISKIVTTPKRWKILEEDIRRCLVNVFPYSVLYAVEEDYVLIVAVAHGKRQPGYWRSRLSKRP